MRATPHKRIQPSDPRVCKNLTLRSLTESRGHRSLLSFASFFSVSRLHSTARVGVTASTVFSFLVPRLLQGLPEILRHRTTTMHAGSLTVTAASGVAFSIRSLA